MIAYKVLDENMNSIVTCLYAGGIEYKFKIKNGPRRGCGALCVFDKKRNAEKFIELNGFGNARIFKVRIKKSENRCYIFDSIGGIKRISTLPEGTILADWVELIEEIK